MLNPAFLDALAAAVGRDNLLTEPADCWPYGYDNSRRHVSPEGVVFTVRHAQVLAIVRLCNEYAVPLTARGRGTGTTGGSVPVRGGHVVRAHGSYPGAECAGSPAGRRSRRH